MSKWIDVSDNEHTEPGTIGYLVDTRNNDNRGAMTLSLRERPLRTNQSNEPRLFGWCGETNNRSRTALGVWKIVRVNKAGDRAQIVKLDGAALATFLDADGHPDLIPATV
jgi:hypothetical protein